MLTSFVQKLTPFAYWRVFCWVLLGGIIVLFACEKEGFEIDPELYAISFLEVETHEFINSAEEMILKGKINRIDSADQNIEKYGHYYVEIRDTSEIVGIESLITEFANVKTTKNVFLFSSAEDDTLGLSSRRFRSFIKTTELDPEKIYAYQAFVKRPSASESRFQERLGKINTFERSGFNLDVMILENSKLIDKMQVLVKGQIIKADSIIIKKYGHRLLFEEDNTMDYDSVITPLTRGDGGIFSGDKDFLSTLSFYDIKHTYYIQSYLIYCKPDDPTLRLQVSRTIDFQSASKGGFWMKTTDMRNQEVESALPPPLENAVSFTLKGNAYIGLGVDENGKANTKFWKFDTKRYTWKEVATFPGKDRKDAVVLTNLNNTTAYVGLGSSSTLIQGVTIPYTDLWRFDGQEWTKINTTSTLKALIQTQYKGNNSTISNLLVNALLQRENPLYFSISGNGYWGGGIGKALVRNINFDITASLPDDKLLDWHDFYKNGEIDSGEWVDLNGDGVVNAGVYVVDTLVQDTTICVMIQDTVIKDTIEIFIPDTIGIDIDYDFNVSSEIYLNGKINPQIEVINFDEELKEFTIDMLGTEGEVTKIVVKPESNPESIELAYKDYKQRFLRIKHCEWYDKNFDKIVDYEEVNVVDTVKNDLYKWTSNSEQWFPMPSSEVYQRYGSIANGGQEGGHVNKIYVLGGNKTLGEQDVAATYELKAQSGAFIEAEKTDARFRRINGFSFVINDSLYFGGGEYVNDPILPSLDIKLYELETDKVSPAPSCGFRHLTNGTAFSIDGKGFLSSGRISPTELTNQVWVYFPPK